MTWQFGPLPVEAQTGWWAGWWAGYAHSDCVGKPRRLSGVAADLRLALCGKHRGYATSSARDSGKLITTVRLFGGELIIHPQKVAHGFALLCTKLLHFN